VFQKCSIVCLKIFRHRAHIFFSTSPIFGSSAWHPIAVRPPAEQPTAAGDSAAGDGDGEEEEEDSEGDGEEEEEEDSQVWREFKAAGAFLTTHFTRLEGGIRLFLLISEPFFRRGGGATGLRRFLNNTRPSAGGMGFCYGMHSTLFTDGFHRNSHRNSHLDHLSRTRDIKLAEFAIFRRRHSDQVPSPNSPQPRNNFFVQSQR